MPDISEQLKEKLAMLPDRPGVYIMKDRSGSVIYVGKAAVLKNRVRSYFRDNPDSFKTQALAARIADLEYIVTANELEALILESTLIKKHRPRYNILLKDDKSYPYLRVTCPEEYPRVFMTRRLVRDGSKYFGPYASVSALRDTLVFLRKLFPLRTCRVLGKRPCLEFHIKRCLAPCAGLVDKKQYAGLVEGVCCFLEGKSDFLIKRLRAAMREASGGLRYEEAAGLRDQIAALENIRQQQTAVTVAGDMDVLGLAGIGSLICAQVFFVRQGKITGRDHFLLSGGDGLADADAAAAFIKQYYERSAFIPKEIVLPYALPDGERPLLTAWLSNLAGRRVTVSQPARGVKKDLLSLAQANARVVLQEEEETRRRRAEAGTAAAGMLAGELGLAGTPGRLDCFDISHTQGSETVAALTVFKDGLPSKKDYRRYKIHSTEGRPDDFTAMKEVVFRRYEQYDHLPDLVIIDGGRGQLNAALEVLRGLGLDLPVIALSERFEEIWREGQAQPLRLPADSPALLLLRRIRDEAHRFAVGYHRKLRARRNLVSVLDNIPEIGASRRAALWEHFGSLRAIREASPEELAGVPGMTKRAAASLIRYFSLTGEGFK